jgi:hypothetical protein
MRGAPASDEGFARCLPPGPDANVVDVTRPPTSHAQEPTVRDLAAALALSHHIPPVPGTGTPSHRALSTGERAVREAYVRRERARRLARRRALLARAVVVIPSPRTPEPR